tara:strand:- start:3439 stop:5400 length:1962 start_codon:yes stop_codon:yes gene_type:complete
MRPTSNPKLPAFLALVPFVLAVLCPSLFSAQDEKPEPIDGYHEFNYGKGKEGAKNWVQAIRVTEPELRSTIEGEVKVVFQAKWMTEATAFCWQQPDESGDASNAWGHDVEITPGGIELDPEGNGSFVFPADEFPNGPINVRILARNEEGKKDIFELQLFNQGGVRWNQGAPERTPPAAKGMDLIFADDFDGDLSISNDGRGATYMAHKPGGGDFSGWQFSNVLGEGKPFDQTGTWLKIAARKDEQSPKGRSGIIASVDRDFSGVWAKPPCYLECRFTAQSAIGTWPAFWTLAFGERGTDELDIVEAYGGKGPGNPNHPGYSIVSHFWRQYEADGSKKKGFSTRADIMNLGGKSYWSTTFHTYGVFIGLEETVYYFDDIEVLRHPTNVSSLSPHFFLINLAIGGISGWPIDLARYDEGSDMWVDYVRVYAKERVPDGFRPDRSPKPHLTSKGVGLSFAVNGDGSTELQPEDVVGADGFSQRFWQNLPGPNGAVAELHDSVNDPVSGMAVKWWVPEGDHAWRSSKGRDWGFKGANQTMQLGHVSLGGSLEVTGVPYPNYDVVVYTGAGDNWGAGSVTISSPDKTGVDPDATHFYKIGWLKGKFVLSEATSLESAENSNGVVFRGNTADSFRLDWTGDLANGQTGVTGLQIVARPE